MRLSALLLALAASLSGETGWRDTSGVLHHPSQWQDKRAVVVFFLMTDCPLSNGYVPEMNRIRAEYERAGVAFYGVLAEKAVVPQAQKHVAEFGYAFPVLLDPQNTLARQTGATVVPEVAVLSPKGEISYLGRIDNRVEDFGRRRQLVTQPELRNALNAVLAGKAPAVARTRAVGCAIDLEGVQ